MTPGYEEDLAWVHDAGFSELAEAAARMLVEVQAPGRVVDLGCGSGLLLDALPASYHKYGVDLSPAMIELAGKRVPTASLRVADAFSCAIPAADAVCAVGEVFSYAAAQHGQQALGRCLQAIFDALPSGGLLLFDVATRGRAPEPTKAHRAGNNWSVYATAIESGTTLTRTITTTVGGRESTEVHQLHLFESDWLLSLLDQVGFDAEHLAGYDDFGFQDGWDGFLAIRR